jgi:hypothetical protein
MSLLLLETNPAAFFFFQLLKKVVLFVISKPSFFVFMLIRPDMMSTAGSREVSENPTTTGLPDVLECGEGMDECAAAMVLMNLSCSPRSPNYWANPPAYNKEGTLQTTTPLYLLFSHSLS